MSVREAMNGKKAIGIAAGCAMIVVAGVFIYMQASEFRPSLKGKAFFTVDDGKTTFLDDMVKIAPFDHEGKQAVRAHVFKCQGKQVVGYLSRYTPEAVTALMEAKKYAAMGKPPPNLGALQTIGTTGQEVKRVGDTVWTKFADTRKLTEIRNFKCADGQPAEEIEPE